MNRSAMADLGLPSATDGPQSEPSDKEGVESRVLVTNSDYLTSEPLDERELRILRILYHGKGRDVCTWSSIGSRPESGTLVERRSRGYKC
jgi:hypothetical protein